MELSHLNEKGEARMVDVSGKEPTVRTAVAQSEITMKPETQQLLLNNGLKKGDALATARIAGIMAAKNTSGLIPLCHPVALDSVEIEIKPSSDCTLLITAIARCRDRTGVEMEALVAASIAALTIYDMAKAVDRGMVITETKLLFKSGGSSGEYVRE